MQRAVGAVERTGLGGRHARRARAEDDAVLREAALRLGVPAEQLDAWVRAMRAGDLSSVPELVLRLDG